MVTPRVYDNFIIKGVIDKDMTSQRKKRKIYRISLWDKFFGKAKKGKKKLHLREAIPESEN